MTAQNDIKMPLGIDQLSLKREEAANKQPQASLFNLIIYAQETERISYFEELIGTILSKFPCRVIFIHAGSGDKEHFNVSFSSVMSGKGSAQAACERITIESSNDQLGRVLSVLFPSLMPDLPIFLLWGQSPFEEHLIFPALQPYASRVIIDAQCYDQLSIFCRQMEVHLKLLKMDLMDMHWAHLSGWRDLLAKIFDRPEKLLLLKCCTSVILSYNHGNSQQSRLGALYLQGWLASCLDARFRKVDFFEDSLLISYYGENNPLVIALEPKTDPSQSPGTLLGMTLAFCTGDSYTITPKPERSQALIHESSMEICSLPYSLPLPHVYSGMTFLNQILYQNAGEHYLKMLRMIAQLTLTSGTSHKGNP